MNDTEQVLNVLNRMIDRAEADGNEQAAVNYRAAAALLLDLEPPLNESVTCRRCGSVFVTATDHPGKCMWCGTPALSVV